MTRQRPVLPDLVQGRLRRLGEDIRSGRNLAPGLEAVFAEFDLLPPELAVPGDREVASLCGLNGGLRISPSGPVTAVSWDGGLLARSPGLEWICIFHGDGRLREQGLDRIKLPPRNAFLFAALAVRLNDWAWQVRAAAERCARRVFPATAPGIVADTAMFLLRRKRHWQRWTGEILALNDALLRPTLPGRWRTGLRPGGRDRAPMSWPRRSGEPRWKPTSLRLPGRRHSRASRRQRSDA